MSESTQVARENEFHRVLTALGVPIFLTSPDTSGPSEYRNLTGWSLLTDDDNGTRLGRRREGDAVRGVMGGRVAVVDVDTKAGADVDRTRAWLDELGVRVYADVLTPSGGRHYYVAGHPDLPTVHADARRDGLDGLPGVELLSFGTNAFLPGTRRPKYDGAPYVVLADDLAALLDAEPDEGRVLAEWVADHRAKRHDVEAFEVAPTWTGDAPGKREAAYLAAMLRNVHDRIASMGKESGRNVALFHAAMCCGNYIAGAGLDEAEAVSTLQAAAAACGLTAEDGERSVNASIRSGLRNGKAKPRTVPPARDEPKPVHRETGKEEKVSPPSQDDKTMGADPVTGEVVAPEGEKKSAAAVLVDLALGRYRFGVTEGGEPFAVPLAGGHVVRMLRGGRSSLRAELAAAYRQITGKVAAQQALADALTTLEGEAQDAEPETVHLRVAEHADVVWLDLGDTSEQVVRIDGGGWRIVADGVPVLFRRTALTGALPVPEAGGDLAELWSLVNVSEGDRPLVLAWLVAALVCPAIPHPILALFGEQGSGKSTGSRTFVNLIDPSPVPLRKPPKDADGWVTAATGSYVVGLDNLSTVPDWLSDSLCRAATGEGDVRRALYTDSGLAVFAFRRVLLLNGIDVGAMRGDLAERLVLVNLDRITESQRLTETELAADWEARHAGLVGALLDLAARVKTVLPSVCLATSPRMADFAKVLAGVDEVCGSNGLQRFAAQARTMAEDTLDADPFLALLRTAIAGEFTGTAAELLAAVTPTEDGWRPSRDWPKNARSVTSKLKRNAPALRKAGWTVEDHGVGPDGVTTWTVIHPEKVGKLSVFSQFPPAQVPQLDPSRCAECGNALHRGECIRCQFDAVGQ